MQSRYSDMDCFEVLEHKGMAISDRIEPSSAFSIESPSRSQFKVLDVWYVHENACQERV